MKSSDAEKQKISTTKDRLKTIYAAAGAVIFLFVSYHGLNSYIDWRIDERIKNADFLSGLARRVRPSVVFDDNGSIIADMGAIQYISDIKVSKGEKDSVIVIITPNEYLGVEPVLEALDAEYSIHAERGKKFDWVFRLYAIQQLVIESSPQRDNQRFRLELIR
jgi:hypothetical protein